MVHHVMALSVLMIVHGSVSILCGLGAGAMALIMPAILRVQGGIPRQPGMPAQSMPPGMEGFLLAFYGVNGVLLLSTGILGIWGGIRIMKFRGRTLGIVTLSAGLLSILSCYCFPTALALFIYGLIVLLNPQVKQAFEMGKQGRSPADIQNHFARLPS